MRKLEYVICPKCQSMMKTVDKNGIHIDQCEECRGIFLDRGELEQIAGAESSYYGSQAPPAYRPDVPHGVPVHHGHGDSPRPYRGGYGDSPKPYRGGGEHGYSDSPRPYGGHRGHRKRGFLENLFD